MKTITDAVNEFKAELRGDVSHVIRNNVGAIARWHDGAPITLLGRCWRIVCTNAEFNAHVKKLTGCPIKLKQWQDSKMKTVYTKAMQDAGELPSVGMECNFVTSFFTLQKSNSGTCKPIAYHNGRVWLDFGSSESVINLSVVWFSPIDTRTDKEKAIDDIHEEMYRRMELKRSDDDCLCSDDTQVGVEFLIEYMDLNFPNWTGK